ncbi:MAG TPA: 16S rRNA (adenine(1518)-N(6)/adenine(1519)-N(6))-dimethyltransferase RsmA [Chthoniobacterales bacterium]|nr:16S rRNA (adenine(1518)-N(6)/adenine(1519)-N(6))-dimethyltransferase RsmA [Chthoniobacterales bacterium]
MNLSQIRTALAHAGVRPAKKLGQSFLHDQNLARWIVQQAQIGAEDFVLEIGPGLGALSGEIARRGAFLLALEKDARLVDFLREKFSDSKYEIRYCDALNFDTRVLFAERNVKVIGNLPYYVASQLLLHFVDFPNRIALGLFMLQDEMARRLCAKPRTADYGALTLRLQLHYHVEYLRRIPRTVFIPRPEVASAIVRFTPRDERQIGISDYKLFREMVKRGFSQRRKQLRNLLAADVGNWEDVAKKIRAPLTARAEELSREQWIELANLIAPQDAKPAAEEGPERFPIVDENDRKIGTATRPEVHENNFRHRAVHILVFNGIGELLLQKRSQWKDRYPLLWDSSAAGHVEANEQYDETADRELNEELGVTAQLRPIGKLPASEKTGQEFIVVYRGKHDGPFAYPSEEIGAVEFFPIDIVNRWVANKPEDFAPGFLESWRLFKR